MKSSLDYFNSYDGTGLFSGTGRYAVLEGRVAICAAQARDMVHFWALLLRRMQWPVPPKSADAVILPMLIDDQGQTLRVLANETSSVVMLARAMHAMDKESRKRIEQEDDFVSSEPADGGKLW